MKSRNTGTRRKAKYSTSYCIRWLFSKMWQWDRTIAITTIIIIPVSVICYALGLYIPSIIIDSLQTTHEFSTITNTIIMLFAVQMVFTVIQSCTGSYRNYAYHRNSMRFYYELIKKVSTSEYHLLLDKEYCEKFRRAQNVLGEGGNGGPGHFVLNIANVAVDIICFIMFGSVVAALNPFVVVLLVVASTIVFVINRWQVKNNYEKVDEQTKNNKALNYVSWKLTADMSAGKDIRLYNMSDFLQEKGNNCIKKHISLLKQYQNNNSVCSIVNNLVIAIRDGISYYFLITSVLAGEITPAEFVLFFSAISQISGFINTIMSYFSTLYEIKLKTSDCIEFLDEDYGELNHGVGRYIPRGTPLSIEFRNVTYKYPKGKTNVLENVSFFIEPGEKISLVGLNGAGKTTLTLLICGLLLPDSGEILIGGYNISEYNSEDLYSLFSLIPQNYTLFPTSIAENIALCERKDIDVEKLWKVIDIAGLKEKIVSLNKGIDTALVKQFDAEAVEFSGGEKQKLLLARALYRDASIMILDEPTAALDPIAENDMYLKYSEITNLKTTIFISHRLASTRFCDRIYLLDGAHFVESGTHDELMFLNGKYRELFDTQSMYYTNGVNADE